MESSKGGHLEAKVGIKRHKNTDSKPAWPSKILTDINDIPKAIQDAQTFLFKNSGKSTNFDVCFDIIEIEVKGPGCADLTLIDLPGIVRTTAEGESATLGIDIKSIIDDFLQNDRCVILAIVPGAVNFRCKFSQQPDHG